MTRISTACGLSAPTRAAYRARRNTPCTRFNSETVNLENFARTDFNTQVQARKLATFDGHDVATIPDDGEKFFRLTARVHKDPTGTLTSYDLAAWEEVPATTPGGGGSGPGAESTYSFDLQTTGFANTAISYPGDGFLYVDLRAGDSVDTPQ